jgi:hypothetical protein
LATMVTAAVSPCSQCHHCPLRARDREQSNAFSFLSYDLIPHFLAHHVRPGVWTMVTPPPRLPKWNNAISTVSPRGVHCVSKVSASSGRGAFPRCPAGLRRSARNNSRFVTLRSNPFTPSPTFAQSSRTSGRASSAHAALNPFTPSPSMVTIGLARPVSEPLPAGKLAHITLSLLENRIQRDDGR